MSLKYSIAHPVFFCAALWAECSLSKPWAALALTRCWPLSTKLIWDETLAKLQPRFNLAWVLYLLKSDETLQAALHKLLCNASRGWTLHVFLWSLFRGKELFFFFRFITVFVFPLKHISCSSLLNVHYPDFSKNTE